MIQPEFVPVIDDLKAVCLRRFGEKLNAIHLAGSVAVGEALAGVSDLDWFMFCDDEPTDAETGWCRKKEADLAVQYPQVNGFHLNLHPVARLEGDVSWRFIVRYTSVRLHGADILSELEKRGIHTPTPEESQRLAAHRIPGVSRRIESVMRGEPPEDLPPLPADPVLASRKLARNFLLVEGGYVLMAMGRFRSFRQADVLPRLGALFPEWQSLFTATERILAYPWTANVSSESYAKELSRFFSWVAMRVPEQ